MKTVMLERLLTGPVMVSTSETVQLAQILSPLLPHYEVWKREKVKEKRRRYGICFGSVILLGLLIRFFPGLQWWIFVHLRIAVTIMPWLSQVRLSNCACLIPSIPLNFLNTRPNVGQEEVPMVGPDCWTCESVSELKPMNNWDTKLISQMATWTQPMLISKENSSWHCSPAVTTISGVMQEVSRQYRIRPNSEPCRVITNFPHSFDEFLVRYDEYKGQPWFSQWQNCNRDVTKALRTLCSRPHFLPRSFSTMGASWIFIATNYDALVFRMAEISEPWFWLTQISGRGVLKLTPKPSCLEICRDIYVELDTNSIVLIPTSIWTLHYTPKTDEKGESIAYGVESYQETRP